MRNFEKHPQNWNLNSEQVAGHFEKIKLFSKTHLLFARKVPSWLVGGFAENFSKVFSFKSEKISQLVSERVKKQPFSLPTYWGDFSRVPWKLNRRIQRICFRQVTLRLPEKRTSAPKKRYAVVRLRGRNDADERQHAKTTAEMRTKNRYHKLRGWTTKMCSEQLEFTHEICGSDWQSLMFCV